MSVSPKTICLTIGDASGIGPEITAKVLGDKQQLPKLLSEHSLVVLGDLNALQQTATQLRVQLPSSDNDKILQYVDTATPDLPEGQVSFNALAQAVQLIQDKQAHILVTGPVSKQVLHQAGLHYGGQTEILEALVKKSENSKKSEQFDNLDTLQADMLFQHLGFRMLLLTRHIPLVKVSDELTPEKTVQSVNNLMTYLTETEKIASPKICFLGVNPHAGEIGGQEEQSILLPAIEKLRASFPKASFSDPKPADGEFRGFQAENPPYDAYVAAYHDQGLIPMKLVSGYEAVNITIGLPFIRASVSHGTAPDIAGQGKATPGGLLAALRLAVKLL